MAKRGLTHIDEERWLPEEMSGGRALVGSNPTVGTIKNKIEVIIMKGQVAKIVCRKGDPMWAYISELIERRRRQVLVHSVIYYELNKNIVTDALWTSWAMELASLQSKYPEIAKECWYAEYFEDFDGSTGFNLPLRDPWAMAKARYLVMIYEQRGENAA